MTFAWPYALLAVLAAPAAVAVYVWMLRRRRRFAVDFSSIAAVKAASPQRSRWRRHLPFALLVAAIAVLSVGVARPRTHVKVPLSQTTIMLALDTSTSMCATDVDPNRLAASQAAATAFIESQHDGTRIGIVAFSGSAQTVVPPTTDTERLVDAIAGFTTSRGTAIGSATLKSIEAISQENPDVAPPSSGGEVATPAREDGVDDFVPDIVVLLTDGATSAGVDPIEAAQQAVDRRVRVYTIGFGTDDPESLVCSRSQLGADALEGPLGSGGISADQLGELRQFIVIDEETLRTMADMTGGAYFRAQDAAQLTDVFARLPAQIELQDVESEVSAGFLIGGALFALAAIVLSLRWNRFY